MSGRAGRTGQGETGESIIMCKDVDKVFTETLIASASPALESCLTEERRGMARPLLESICSGVVLTVHDVEKSASSFTSFRLNYLGSFVALYFQLSVIMRVFIKPQRMVYLI
jgi:replicative superfamily II helicase